MEDKIETILKRNFQKNIEIEIDDKVIKKGKFILYKMSTATNYFHIELYIERNSKVDKIDTFKLPYPFAIEEYEDEDLYYFDYRAKTLLKRNNLCNKFQSLSSTSCEDDGPLKFYDKIVVIKFV